MWNKESGETEFNFGFVEHIKEDGTVTVDHLEQKTAGYDRVWQRPGIDDIHSVEKCQIIKILVDREWDFSKKPLYTIKNIDSIKKKFLEG